MREWEVFNRTDHEVPPEVPPVDANDPQAGAAVPPSDSPEEEESGCTPRRAAGPGSGLSSLWLSLLVLTSRRALRRRR
jgi:hypothetical protein